MYNPCMTYFKITDLNLKNKRVLIRSDLNVPIQNGHIMDDTRIKASLPTWQYALSQGAKQVLVLSHLGRPTAGVWQAIYSLEPIAKHIETLLKTSVSFERDWLSKASHQPFIICENVRFNKGETEDDEALAQKMATLCDVFVMDAFGSAHRAQASTHGVAKFARENCTGLLLTEELEALYKVLKSPKRPLTAIVGGSKVSSKLEVLEFLLQKVDTLIVGGGIANTFLKAKGYPIGRSLCEDNLMDTAEKLLKLADANQVQVLLPTDVIVSDHLAEDAKATTKLVSAVSAEDSIFDIGPDTQKAYRQALLKAGTVLWNGPLGVFELSPFASGTKALALAIAESPAFKVAGGGDTIAAIEKFHITKHLDFISTGGGAFLEYIAGQDLPGVTILEEKHQHAKKN